MTRYLLAILLSTLALFVSLLPPPVRWWWRIALVLLGLLL